MALRALMIAGLVAFPQIALSQPVDNSSVEALQRVASRSPSDAAAQYELAVGYFKAGQTADARTAFRHVLSMDNVTLTTPKGEDVWSHQLARRALSSDVLVAAR